MRKKGKVVIFKQPIGKEPPTPQPKRMSPIPRQKHSWAELARDFERLAAQWGPIEGIDARVYWTACTNFAHICREADLANYANPEVLKGALLMEKLAAKNLRVYAMRNYDSRKVKND